MSSDTRTPRYLRPLRRSRQASERGPEDKPRGRRRRLTAGGTDGNERLTVMTGVVLIILTAAIGVTIVWIGQLMWLHLFLGLALIGPVALKLASTGYRFVRYYTHDPAYRRKGPPIPVLRVLAPLVVLLTVALLGTGVALLFAGRDSGPLGEAHKICFFVWITFTAIHVLGHLPEILRVLSSSTDSRRQIMALPVAGPAGVRPNAGIADRPAGGPGRAGALLISLLASLVLATALIGQFSVWTHSAARERPAHSPWARRRSGRPQSTSAAGRRRVSTGTSSTAGYCSHASPEDPRGACMPRQHRSLSGSSRC
jgi:hypothetical protein